MCDNLRKSTLVPIYKNKGDVQICESYKGIKLISVEILEIVIGQKLRTKIKVAKKQFGFIFWLINNGSYLLIEASYGMV